MDEDFAARLLGCIVIGACFAVGITLLVATIF